MTNPAARRWLSFLLALLGPVIVLTVWEILARTHAINPLFFPPPTSLEATARDLISSGQLWDDVRISMLRIGGGFLIAAVPGVLIGVLMGLWWPVRAIVSPIAAAFFAVPKIAILPLVIIIFGIGETSKVAMVAVSVLFLVVLATMSAVLEIEDGYFDVARNAGASTWQQVRTVALPAALPGIFSGLRLALGFSLLVIVGTEFLAAKNGIGYLIWNSYQTFAIEKMYVGLIVTGLLGWLLNLVMDEVERVVMPWRASVGRRFSIPIPDTARNWFMATRPFSFTASIIPAFVGTALAAYTGSFSLGLFLLVVVASLLVHAGTNLVNDYFDDKHGADTPETVGNAGFIQRGIISPRAILAFGFILFGIATSLGLVIVARVGWPVLLFAIPSLLAGYFYTGGPKPLGYVALGEATVFLFMGPMIVVGAYYVQTQQVSWEAVALSIPVGLLVTAIIQANNIRDIPSDAAVGKRTLATYIGQRWARREYIALVVGAYVVVALVAVGGLLPAGLLVVFLTLPRAIELVRIVNRRDDVGMLNTALRLTAGLHLQFGALMSLVLLVAAIR
ncbi:MAG TPA: 1,4-dihydroxy-2-naphthoate octaprenyltransferase [Thermomicrobiales bacterium]|nr:1,4-dihydroxy-2-naphthoate octaprenyltransferase [Thermomicrobiales bacterium]